MRKRVIVALLAVIYGLICLGIGWIAGIDSGFDTGYRVAYIEMDRLLRQGMKEGVNFYVEGLNIKFSPGEESVLKISAGGNRQYR
ncbi:MAG: hypothetical protein AB1553_11490 [Nitrospirota bacterium]